MERIISDLLNRYETGALSRRELVGGIAALSVTGTSAIAAPVDFECNSINHVSITCSDLSRTVEFYKRVFGLKQSAKVVPNGAEFAVGNTQHISIKQGSTTGIDHFAMGLNRFDMDQVIASLKASGASPLNAIDAGLHVLDPDGVAVQLIANGDKAG